jgi:hypothetical protein
MQFLNTVGGWSAGTATPAAQGGKVSAATGDRSGGFADLSMYQEPPTENITLEEFESLALARLSGGCLS